MLEVIKLILFSLIQIITFTYIVSNITERKFQVKSLKNWIMILLMTIIMGILWKYNYNFFKPFLIYGLMIIGYIIIFDISLQESVIINFITILLTSIFEAILSLFVIYILRLPQDLIIQFFKGTPISSILILLMSVLVVKLTKNKIIRLKNIMLNEKLLYIFYFIVIFGLSLFFGMNINNWQNNYSFVINTVTVILFIIIILYLLQEKIRGHFIKDGYDKMEKYLKDTESLLEKYQKYNHENKNQLIVLKNLTLKNKKALEFIDSILEDDINHQNRWINDLKYIPSGGLKGLLSYKINSMIDNGIKVTINISPRIKNINFKNVKASDYKDICRVIGVYIDNAYEASIESNKKEVTIEMLLDDNVLTVIISNTFKGKINIDEIDKEGVTTKGKGHGFGLSLVKEIIKKNKILSQKKEIIEDYYFQYLFIGL